MAGKGTRLLPLTKRVPKPLVNVAGQAVMDYVMDALRRAGQLDELIIITGHLKEKVEAYGAEELRHSRALHRAEGARRDGRGGEPRRPYVDGPVIVIFVDTLFDADLSIVKTTKADGIIWTKEVEDYQRFGVVVTDKQGHMTRIVEKPNTPISKRANIGLQYVKDWRTLFDGIEHVLKSPPAKGGEFLSHGRVPVHGGPGEEAVRQRSRRLVRLRQGGIRCSKRTSIYWSTAAASAPQALGRCEDQRTRLHRRRRYTQGRHDRSERGRGGAGSSIVGSTVANSILGRASRSRTPRSKGP